MTETTEPVDATVGAPTEDGIATDATERKSASDTKAEQEDPATEDKAKSDPEASEDATEGGDEAASGEDDEESEKKQPRSAKRIKGLKEALRQRDAELAVLNQRLQRLSEPKFPDVEEDDYFGQQAKRTAEMMTDHQRAEAQAELDAVQRQRHLTRREMFVAKCEAELPNASEMLRAYSQVPVTDLAADIMAESDVGPQMAAFLAHNPQAAVDIARLHPVQQAIVLTRLEARLSAAPKVKRISQAPAPIKPVQASVAKAASKDPSEMTEAEYQDYYQKRQAKRNR